MKTDRTIEFTGTVSEEQSRGIPTRVGDRLSKDLDKPINMLINSVGGNISVGYFLYDFFLMQKIKLSERDITILGEIAYCESGWRQYNDDGTVLISIGNFGLFQVNRFAHQARYTSLGIDIETPEGNIAFAILLYTEQYLTPWDQWSGHCWRPRLAALGVKL